MTQPVTDPTDPIDPTAPTAPTEAGQDSAEPTRTGEAAPTDESAYSDTLAELEQEVSQERTGEAEPYDAVVLVSFGGPEAPEEVMPFLRRVTRGRGIPDERLETVAEHYHAFGGKSPINEQNRDLLAALGAEFARRDIATPLLWGNRNSEPFLTDTLRGAASEGMTRFLAVTTSAYSSYSSCRQYREDIAESIAELTGEGTPVRVDKIRQYWNHPGFASTNARLVSEAARQVRDRTETVPHVVFVTHSIPDAMDDTSGPGDGEGNAYSSQHEALAEAITAETKATLGEDIVGELTYCSRSGSPSQPWLEPDVNDRLRELAADGVKHVVLAPIGFVSDHMEVVFDLDTEAQETAAEVGIEVLRVPTVGVDPQFVSGLVDLVVERSAQARGESVEAAGWPVAEPWPAVCRPGCCPNLRVAKPAACGSD